MRAAAFVAAFVSIALPTGAPRPASAGPVSLLDSFPAAGRPLGPDAGLVARAVDAQSIALPFEVRRAGRLTGIDTGIHVFSGGFGSGYSLTLSVVDERLPGSGHPYRPDPGLATFMTARFTARCGGFDFCLAHPEATQLDATESVSMHGLSLWLEPGHYWLMTAFDGDMVEAEWLTNPDLPSKDWARHVIGRGDGRDGTPHHPDPADWIWRRLDDRAPMPAARISFERALGDASEALETVPVPAPLALLALGGALLAATRRRGVLSPR